MNSSQGDWFTKCSRQGDLGLRVVLQQREADMPGGKAYNQGEWKRDPTGCGQSMDSVHRTSHVGRLDPILSLSFLFPGAHSNLLLEEVKTLETKLPLN